jgi:hypothetical protein
LLLTVVTVTAAASARVVVVVPAGACVVGAAVVGTALGLLGLLRTGVLVSSSVVLVLVLVEAVDVVVVAHEGQGG